VATFLTPFRPWSLPIAGTQQMQAAMQKYANFTKAQFPNLGQYESWVDADLMIEGLQLAGPNPTKAAVISKLRGVKSYNANGLLPDPLNDTNNFGHDPAQTCAWVMKAGPNGFTALSSKPACGTDIPGTSTAS
jgi:branched-chain amino acid transport system substrate-binding protein